MGKIERPNRMTQESHNNEFFLLRRGDQVVVAVVLLLGIVALTVWWTFQTNREERLVELDQAEPRAYSFKLDINHAPWHELAQLPDVGEVTARKIVASRKSEGPFTKIEDLSRVHGIGPKTVERIRPYLLPVEDHNSGE